MKNTFAFLSIWLLISTNWALSASPQPPLNSQDLQTLISGNSMVGNGNINAPAKPYDWIAYYAPDGSITMRLKPEWGGTIGTGKWWITEKGELCRKFKKMASGKEGCWHLHPEGDFYRFVPSSGVAVEGRTAIIQGNHLE